MDTLNHIKHVISQAASYTFSRITFYLTLFNFFMLANWMFDNTSVGDWMKENHFRPGDMLAIILFTIFAISALEYIVIGRNKEEEY
jgi:hypothetical protein